MLRPKWNLVFVLLVFGSLLASCGAAAQSLGSGLHTGIGCSEFRIQVSDADGHAICGATVSIDGRGLAVSDSSGWVDTRVGESGDGFLLVRVTAEGYQTREVTIEPGDCITQIDLKRTERGRRSYTSAITAEELNPEVQKRSVELQRQASKASEQADYAGSVRLLLEAFDLTPSDPGISNNLGFSYLHKGEINQASVWFEKALSLAPFDPIINGNLGVVRWSQGDRDTSRQLLTKAVQHGYSTPAAHYILGVTALEKGHAMEAVKELSMVKDKQFPYRPLFLAIALWSEGKPDKAEKEYNRFLRSYRITVPTQPLGRGPDQWDLAQSHKGSETVSAGDLVRGTPNH